MTRLSQVSMIPTSPRPLLDRVEPVRLADEDDVHRRHVGALWATDNSR